MRLIYVTVVASLVFMILIGSYFYTPTGLKAAVTRPIAAHVKGTGGSADRGDALSVMFHKYKAELFHLLQLKKKASESFH